MQNNFYFIDKTATLEKGILAFPSLYIEGAAATGKTTAVRQLIEQHPEICPIMFDMQKERRDERHFQDVIEKAVSTNKERVCWYIFENVNENLESGIEKAIVDFIKTMPENCRAIIVGRVRPGEELLELLWKRQMDLLTQKDLFFTKAEVSELISKYKSPLSPKELYEITGGWAGCVDMMIRFSLKNINEPWGVGFNTSDIKKLRESYEIESYIQREIVKSLSEEEQKVFGYNKICPWLNIALCREMWNVQNAEQILENLTRKGILIYDGYARYWKLSPLFSIYRRTVDTVKAAREQGISFWESLGEWYDKNGFTTEALHCYKNSKNELLYQKCIIQHYKQVPLGEISYAEVMEWKGNIPQLIYLRGMYCYEHQDFHGLDREIEQIQEIKISADSKNAYEDKKIINEILLNLYFVKPDFTLDEWLELLAATKSANKQKFELYNILGNGQTYLCGLRDLTGLFACSKKEENQKAKLWQESLGEEEKKAYRLARIDYYLETERLDMIQPKDLQLLKSEKDISVLYLLIKMQRQKQEEERAKRIEELEEILRKRENANYTKNVNALLNLYSPHLQKTERLSYWLRNSEKEAQSAITEENYMIQYCLVKGYLFLGQYEKAEKILVHLIPYLQAYRRGYHLAECLYQMAIIKWETGQHGQALQNIIESFLISRQARYVDFYISYGKKGKDVMESYIQWQQANEPEGWHRKKKYQYGNVLRMPEADYIGVVMRRIKRQSKANQRIQTEMPGERLTMMETIILQDINRGLTNTEICEALNLKLPTVKTHIYNLYKKMGVTTRVQAILKGKELGMLD